MMPSAFVVVVALMVLAAIAAVIYPLLRPQVATAHGEPATPRAAPLAFALAVAVALGAVGLYANLNTFPWDNPLAVEALPAGHGEIGAAGAMNEVTAALEARLARDPNDRDICLRHNRRRLGLFACGHDSSPSTGRRLVAEHYRLVFGIPNARMSS